MYSYLVETGKEESLPTMSKTKDCTMSVVLQCTSLRAYKKTFFICFRQMNIFSEDILVERLASFTYTAIPFVPIKGRYKNFASWLDSAKRAAVLVPLTIRNGEVYVILTLRSPTLGRHGGEVSFPGGMKDPHEVTAKETAIRESFEEIGLAEKDVKVVSQYVPWISRFRVLVFPVIGLVSSEFTASDCNEHEVSYVFQLPLSRFLDSKDHHAVDYNGYKVHFFIDDVDKQNFVTWGMTADICIHVAVMVFGRKPDFKTVTDINVDNLVASREKHFLNISKKIMEQPETNVTSKL